jgi:TRAP-type mannitol/chloroaromatic compound transport system permease large subunit
MEKDKLKISDLTGGLSFKKWFWNYNFNKIYYLFMVAMFVGILIQSTDFSEYILLVIPVFLGALNLILSYRSYLKLKGGISS